MGEDSQAKPGRSRAGPALVLLLLSPAVGELLSGSAPPAEFFQPLALVFLVLLYGIGALLCRELTFSWGKGWATLLMLGAAYGVIEEGLVVASFFNPAHADLGLLKDYGRWVGVNWIWSLDLTVYHAVFSIGVCVLLVSRIFPDRRDEPWVGRRTFVVLVVLFLAFGHMTGFTPPVGPYLASAATALALVILARRLPAPAPARPGAGAGAAHPFWFGLVGFLATCGFYAHLLASPLLGLPPPVAALAML
ncbi:MAG: hypothetical protein ACYS1C_02930, partial [Planctomycetota bacterium]